MNDMVTAEAVTLREAIENNTAVAGVIGLGYVGLPLAVEMARAGFRTIGYDVSQRVVDTINGGSSHILDIESQVVKAFVGEGLLAATTDSAELRNCDIVSICVPTPLSKTKDPDLSYIAAAAQTLKTILRPGQLIILESTTFPGTTRDVLLPVLEQTGLKVGQDFFLCFSPERVDPGNSVWNTKNTPKVIGAITPSGLEVATAFYGRIFDTMVPVPSVEAAELVKVYENTYRMINIALANELAQMCEKLHVDVWDVIDAAATKPFGFQKFTPGPGLGGHCIPLDPHYLSWKMRTLAYRTRMIEVASDINSEMPQFVVRKAGDVLNSRGKALHGSAVLVLGVAYKKDIDDLRESPAIDIIRLLMEKGADVAYHDPYCSFIADDGHTDIPELPMASIELNEENLRKADLVLVLTDHSTVDYDFVAHHSALILDTRGALRNVQSNARIVTLSGTVDAPGRGAVERRNVWAGSAR